MPVIEAQRASILVPHDHRHINHVRTFLTFIAVVLLVTERVVTAMGG